MGSRACEEHQFKHYDSSGMEDWKKPILKTYKCFLRTDWSKWDPHAHTMQATHRDIFLQVAFDKAIPISDTLKLRYVQYIEEIKQSKGDLRVEDRVTVDSSAGNEGNDALVHTTKLLQILEDAKKVLWSNYDSNNPKTGPTNETVEKWLVKEKKVSKRLAKSMATILRADDIPDGPRTHKSNS
jgi:hypothetical protein